MLRPQMLEVLLEQRAQHGRVHIVDEEVMQLDPVKARRELDRVRPADRGDLADDLLRAPPPLQEGCQVLLLGVAGREGGKGKSNLGRGLWPRAVGLEPNWST